MRKSSNLFFIKGIDIRYEEIRDKLISQGMSPKAAKTKAAKIWNSKHKGKKAVGRGREST